MENFFTRYKNPLVLMLVLFVQVVYLATQIPAPSRNNSPGGGRLIRKWAITTVTPFEEAIVGTSRFFRHGWSNYIDLHNVRKQNRDLEAELARMRLEQARLQSAADQNQRLQALLDFKQHYIGQTVAAQVIQSSGSEQSRVVIIDKGSRAGIAPDMAVITPGGIVGKVREVYPLSSQVLLVNDRESGAGVILQNSRLQGVLRGTAFGELRLSDIMSDEKVEAGEQIITSGGDRIYPKGLPVGTVTSVGPDPEGGPFLNIGIRPAANLDRLEEVLVVTKIAESQAFTADNTLSHRAVDVLAQRLPSIPKTPEPAPGTKPASQNAAAGPSSPLPDNNPEVKKPAGNTNQKKIATEPAPGTKPASQNAAAGSPSPSPDNNPEVKKPASATNQKKIAPGAVPQGTATPGAAPDARQPRKPQPDQPGTEKPPR
jgi:rod shape-determining protein MreC